MSGLEEKLPIETQKDSTEQRIFDAAHEIFVQKGLDGAKMQEIADKAGINKALLHYYYRSKEKLYEMVARAVLSRNVPLLRKIIEGNLPLEDKIRAFIGQYIDIIAANHFLPLFIISEMNKHPDRFIDQILPKEFPKPELFFQQVEEAVQKGQIRPVDPKHLVVNIVSMCIFPFIAKPMLRILLGMSTEEWKVFLKARKGEIEHFVLASLKP
jgi:TetR/AcrR family transcriptional regulator